MERCLPLAFNQRLVICLNPFCEYKGKERVASLPLIGTELYCQGTITCKCGYIAAFVEE